MGLVLIPMLRAVRRTVAASEGGLSIPARLSGSVPDGTMHALFTCGQPHPALVIMAASRNAVCDGAQQAENRDGVASVRTSPMFPRYRFLHDLQEGGEDDPAALIQFHKSQQWLRPAPAESSALQLSKIGREQRRAEVGQGRTSLRKERQVERSLMPNVTRLLIQHKAASEVTDGPPSNVSLVFLLRLRPPRGTSVVRRRVFIKRRQAVLMRWHSRAWQQ